MEQKNTGEKWATLKNVVSARVVLHLEVLGVAVALILALWHAHDLKTTKTDVLKATDETHQTLKLVQLAMSTRSLGPFPDFVDDVERLVDGAQRNLIIASDFAAYGEFDGKGTTIRQAIEKRVNAKLPVHLTLLSQAKRDQARQAQFPKATWASSIAPGSPSRDHILNFLSSHGVDKSDPTHDDLIEALTKYDEVVARQMFRGADIVETAVDMPVLFWIADGKRAVVIVQGYGGKEESAFWTTDPGLIIALQSLADRYRQYRAAPRPASTKPPA